MFYRRIVGHMPGPQVLHRISTGVLPLC
jgi:hypothetical protein